jgi:hypothetical protein
LDREPAELLSARFTGIGRREDLKTGLEIELEFWTNDPQIQIESDRTRITRMASKARFTIWPTSGLQTNYPGSSVIVTADSEGKSY